MLCVNINSIKVNSKEVQRDIKLEDILLNHTKYFDSVDQALEENYAPLDFCTCVRSTYDNTVLEYPYILNNGDELKRYYQLSGNVPLLPHKGYDLVMYMTSIGLMQGIHYKKGFDELMMKQSMFMCIGLFNPNPYITNPMVVSHIIMTDDGMNQLKDYLKEGTKVISIDNIKKEGNMRAILDTLIKVKEEKHD